MYERRLKAFLVLMAIGAAVLLGRLGQLQLLRGREYRQQVERLLLQPPELHAPRRGMILDRTGQYVLAMEKPCYDFCLHYGLLTEDARWIRRQKRLIRRREGVSKEEAEAIFRERVARTWEKAKVIASQKGVDLNETVNRIRQRVEDIRLAVARKLQIPNIRIREQNQLHAVVRGLDHNQSLDGTVGAEFRRSLKRWYPYGSLACHVIGLTGQVSRKELEELNGKGGNANGSMPGLDTYIAGDVIGKRGVEKLCEKTLRGRRGYRLFKRKGDGYETIERKPVTPGTDVRTTIDLRLQAILTQQLQDTGHNGSIVVLSVKTGQVLAMGSVPVFDLNRYRRRDYYDQLIGDKENVPLFHRAVARLYPPGSTIKPIVALAALSWGLVKPDEKIHCSGALDPNRPGKFRCWKRTGHGWLDLAEAIQHSCNVYFYTLGGRLGVRGLAEWFARFGLARTAGTGLPGEVRGRVLPRGRGIVPADAWLMGIGQGPVVLTPLHVANAMATIARGGVYLSPAIVLNGGPAQVRRDLGIDPRYIKLVHRGMWKVVNEHGGTANRYFRDAGLDVEVCGKTGTAQDPGRQGDMAWFSGFAPYGNPQIAFAIVIEYVEGGGAANAAPIAVELVRTCRQLGYIR